MLLSSIKFLFAPPAVLAVGFSFWETIAITIAGGWIGVWFFYFFGKWAIDFYNKKYPPKEKKKQLKFTWKNKLIIKVKSGFGIYGLAFISPVTISIPVGSILAARYFSQDKKTVFILMAGIILWSFALTLFFTLFK